MLGGSGIGRWEVAGGWLAQRLGTWFVGSSVQDRKTELLLLVAIGDALLFLLGGGGDANGGTASPFPDVLEQVSFFFAPLLVATVAVVVRTYGCGCCCRCCCSCCRCCARRRSHHKSAAAHAVLIMPCGHEEKDPLDALDLGRQVLRRSLSFRCRGHGSGRVQGPENSWPLDSPLNPKFYSPNISNLL